METPDRVNSPPPRLVGGRGVSLDRQSANARPIEVVPKAKFASSSNPGALDRPGSRNSVNFSRPMSPQNSPPSTPLIAARAKSPLPNKSAGSSKFLDGEENKTLGSIQETDAAPVSKKKKATGNASAVSGHPAVENPGNASQNVLPQQMSQTQPLEASNPPLPNAGTAPSGVHELPKSKKKKKKVRLGTSSQDQDAGEGFSSAYPSDTDSLTSERSSSSEKPRSYNTRAAGLLMKQPSIVREDREAEEKEESRLPGKETNGQLDQHRTIGEARTANTSKIVSKSSQSNRAVGQVATPKTAQRSSLDVPGASRHQSLSPARSTHFSSHPEYETPDGIKHQPPARSVSPAKSALKHSPSRGQSPIGSLPVSRRTGFAGSEASDTASNISDDGLRSVSRKKNARVSFDDDMVTIGRAASPPMSPDSPVLMSPQTKPKGRSWFDLVREKKPQEAAVDSDPDTAIKPTPALPSFGSIRRDRSEEANFDAKGEPNQSNDYAQDTLGNTPTSSDQVVGSIIAQNAFVKSQDFGAQSTDPLPPEVTSVEGSGYHSDDEAHVTDEQQEKDIPELMNVMNEVPIEATGPLKNEPVREIEIVSEASHSPEQNTPVPSIALQPATPGLEISNHEEEGWLGMPGEFPDSIEASDSVHSPPVPVTERSPMETPVNVGSVTSEGKFVIAPDESRLLSGREVLGGLQSQIDPYSSEESDDTGASIYSDAAEDPNDLGGDGFGSINAIVGSPAQSPTVPFAAESPPASLNLRSAGVKPTKPSLLTRQESELSEPASEEGWDRAQAYWSGLSQERRRQLEQAAVPGALDQPVIPNKTMRGPNSVRKKKKTKKSASPPGSGNPPLPPWPDRQYRGEISQTSTPIAPPKKSSLRNSQNANLHEPLTRTSMRNTQGSGAQEPRMRSSMRNDVPTKASLVNGSQRNSMQLPVAEPRGALHKKVRPTSAVAMVDYNKPQPTPAIGHTRAVSAGVPKSALTPVSAQPKKKAPSKKSILHRNDSDSSSSFKKGRLSTPGSGKYTMKRTMRPSSTDTRGPAGRASSLNDRNVSPAGSPAARPFHTVNSGSGGMRTSMRDSVDAGRPAARISLRESSDSKAAKPQSRFAFGKSAKPKSADPKPSSRLSSRFADSSDEEDIMPARNSRFADSSDDEPSHLTPVRGIPRRVDEGDSTDLEDSSLENTATLSKFKVNGTALTLDTKPEGVALASGSLRVASGDKSTAAMGAGLQAKKAAEKDKKKRSFFGSLSSKRRDDPSRVEKAKMESPARRDTPLERSKTERLLTTGSSKEERILGPSSPQADPVALTSRPVIDSRTGSTQNSPKSPKLQRRNTPKRLTSANDISWPLPQNLSETSDMRPRTSDGAAVTNGTNGSGRPELGVRRTTVQEASLPLTAPLIVGRGEKKKRFGMLRKAFGMQS